MKQDKQLGDRVAESHIIDLSFCRMNSFTRKDTAKHASVTLKGNQFVIIDNHLELSTARFDTKWLGSNSLTGPARRHGKALRLCQSSAKRLREKTSPLSCRTPRLKYSVSFLSF